MSWRTRLDHINVAAAAAPGLLRPSRRRLLGEMRRLCRQLPLLLRQPLPQAMAQLTPDGADGGSPLPGESATRRLVDLAALLERKSPLGLCLRRSLLRYHYLRQLRLPLVVRFGAKLSASAGERDIIGHAWLTLDDQPYYEAAANWRDFTVIVSWPTVTADAARSGKQD